MNTKSIQNKQNVLDERLEEESDSKNDNLVKTQILGVGITNETEENILEYIVKNLPKQQTPYYIVTPNPEILVYANSHKDFKTILNNAKIALTDGVGLLWGARFVGKPLIERIIGTDFMEMLCEKVANRPITVGFLGGGPKIAEQAAERLQEKYPGLKVVYSSSEWGKPSRQKEVVSSQYSVASQKKKEKLLTTNYNLPTTERIDILFVALGFPKQEQWMADHLSKIPVKVMMGVGGAFDQIVDGSLRPPQIVHQLGLGWLYRLIREPWRLKRQAKLVEFVKLVLKEKMKQS